MALATIVIDFMGKTAASTVNNPHIAKRLSGTNTTATTLQAPNSSQLIEFPNQPEYDKLKSLDANLMNTSNSANGVITQQLFSFDIIAALERHFGISVWNGQSILAQKVAIVRTIITNIRFDWFGFGSSVGGNGVSIKAWWYNGGSSSYQGTATHSSGIVSNLFYTSLPTSYIDNNGIIHFLAHTNVASNGTTASIVNTDYVSLTLTVNWDNILVSDTFTRINNTTSLGTADSGHVYRVDQGTFGINSNQAYTPLNTYNSFAVVNANQSDVRVGMDVPVYPAGGTIEIALYFRYKDSTNHYVLWMNAYSLSLDKKVNDSITNLANEFVGYGAGYRLTIEGSGSTIKVYYGGVLKFTVTDSTFINEKYHGFGNIEGGTTPRFDNFAIIGSPPPATTNLKRYDGSVFQGTPLANIKRYNGTSFVSVTGLKRFNGTIWVDI